MQAITALLSRLGNGDRDAFDHLVPLVYHELHRIAEGYLRRERAGHTLQPTALIHEAYLRLAGYEAGVYRNRTHFFAVAARVMRQILVDHARSRKASKRGAGERIALNESVDFSPGQEATVVALDQALLTLAAEDEAKAGIVEMRFFGGMTAEEIAQYLDMPVHTVRRQLRLALVWLRREIER